jgi:hypothetical protein
MNASGPDPSLSRTTFWGLFLALVLVRVPYFLTHHIQEDAYIAFRTAFNLADHGVYSFNVDEHAPGATSLLFGFLEAGLRLIFGGWAIGAILIASTIMVVGAAWLLAAALMPPGRWRAWLWAAAALMPTGLLISYSGMETALLVAAVALAVYGLGKDWRWTWIGLFLLPLIRVDAIAFGLIIIAAAIVIDWRRALVGFGALAAGYVVLLASNYALSGELLSRTMTAKEVSFHPDRSIGAILARLIKMFLTGSFLVPVETTVLMPISPLFALLFAAGMAVALWFVRSERFLLVRVGAMIAAIVLVPAAYALGGVLFSWYVWPSAWLAQVLMAFALIRWAATVGPPASRWVLAALGLGLVVLDLARLVVSYNVGAHEYRYRADVGRFIAGLARRGDTLFLEPAGYIPFYAGIKTFDEVGLASPEILRFKERDPNDWWGPFLREKHPTFVVQRQDFRHYQTYDGYHFTPAEIAWFERNYELVREFKFDPAVITDIGLARRMLGLSHDDEYLVFRYRGDRSGQS